MQNDMKQRRYMALATLASLAGILINPLASIIAPQTQQLMGTATANILAVFVVLLLYAAYRAFNAKTCQHIIFNSRAGFRPGREK